MLTIQSFKVFDQIYLLTQGGPGTSTLVLVYHIYNEAFISWDLGYSSMIALVLFFIVLGSHARAVPAAQGGGVMAATAAMYPAQGRVATQVRTVAALRSSCSSSPR